MSGIIVFYDGQCELCKNSVIWIRKKLEIQALDYHQVELEKYDLTFEQCSKEVIVICQSQRYTGAEAAAFLLQKRGNVFLAKTITTLPSISRFTYRWIATHRRSLPVKFLSYLLRP